MTIDPVADTQSQLANLINLLGSSGTYTITKTGVSKAVVGLVSPVDKKDVDLINAIGIGGVRLTFQASAFAQRPVKFDTWTVLGRKYVFDSVTEILVKSVNVGWTVYCRGGHT